ncbi:uncharacterized protein LOC135226299 [Macrobrachium nipponense]|uniref:uncharacterized protein LOC135226299 n=1 Tax=Macrobrachium nipponense TaxID=159736 RepID=UPI0030C8B182
MTDQRPTITSELFSFLACLMGTKHHTTMSYNPAANSVVERVHRSIKASLTARCHGSDWKAQLPLVLLSLRTAPRANSDPSPAEKVFFSVSNKHCLPALDEVLPRTVPSHPSEGADIPRVNRQPRGLGIDRSPQAAIIPNEDDPTEGPHKTPTLLVPDSTPKRRRGRPRKAVEPSHPTTRAGILLSGPQEDEDTQDALQPRES